MRVYSRLLRTESVFCRGHGEKKNSSSLIQLPRRDRAGGATGGSGGQHGPLHTSFLTQGLNKEAHQFPKCALTSLISPLSFPPPLNVSKLFSPTSFPATCTPDVTPNPSSVRTHPSQIHFAGNCLKVLFRSLT